MLTVKFRQHLANSAEIPQEHRANVVRINFVNSGWIIPPIWLQVEETGLTLGDAYGDDYRFIPWQDVARLRKNGLPDPCRYGVVVDGVLAEAVENESAARERQTHHRGHGCQADVIRLPVDPV